MIRDTVSFRTDRRADRLARCGRYDDHFFSVGGLTHDELGEVTMHGWCDGRYEHLTAILSGARPLSDFLGTWRI